MFQPNTRQINGGPGPTLGSLVQKPNRQVNPGAPVPPQQGFRGNFPGHGGGLMRLMEMYGRPGRGHGAMYK